MVCEDGYHVLEGAESVTRLLKVCHDRSEFLVVDVVVANGLVELLGVEGCRVLFVVRGIKLGENATLCNVSGVRF